MIKKEHLLAGLITIFMLVFSNAYLLYGIMVPKDGMEFLGRRFINSQDTYTYIAFIEQARQGKIFFENLYTSDPQTATLIRPSYAFLGGVANVLGTSSAIAYHLGRIASTILFCVVLYVFLGLFFKTPKKRLLAFAVTLFSSGVGYLTALVGVESSDLWIPESITFLSLQEAPHFIFSQTLMLLSFYFLFRAWSSRKMRYFFLTAAPLLFLGFEHPYNLFVCAGVAIIAGIYFMASHKIEKKQALLGIGSVLAGCVIGNSYQAFELYRNPILKSWAFPSDSPIPAAYLLGYGLIVVFALIGIEKYLKEKHLPQVLILSWVAVSGVLLYAPVYFQRRLSEGLHIPLSILAAEGIIILSLFLGKFVIHRIRNTVVYTFACIIVVILSLGSLEGVYSDLGIISADHQKDYYYYLLNQEMRAAHYIRDNSNSDDVILSNWFYGNILPGLTGRKVYVGHKAQTNNFDQKIEEVNKFLLNKDATTAYKFLNENKIKYIFVGKNDTVTSYGFKPAEKPYLEKVFDEGEAKVYRVK